MHLPRPWHLELPFATPQPDRARILLGRQGIFSASRDLVAYELLFRSPGYLGLRVDLWDDSFQNRATEHVISAAFYSPRAAVRDHPTFINFTRSYLLEREDLHCDPDSVVIEVVESAHADASLHSRIRDLRSAGYRIAVDDFVGTSSQMSLIESADFVKVDFRDLVTQGPDLAARAGEHGSVMIAERVETRAAQEACEGWGFTLFQGHGFEPAIVMDRGHDESWVHGSGVREPVPA